MGNSVDRVHGVVDRWWKLHVVRVLEWKGELEIGVAGMAGCGEWRWRRGRARAVQGKNKGLTGGVHLTQREEREEDKLERHK
jgi:hypothetical protein